MGIVDHAIDHCGEMVRNADEKSEKIWGSPLGGDENLFKEESGSIGQA